LPFGEELTTQGVRTPQLGYNADSVRQKFTQKERDNETGLDYFETRYYGNTQGRFTGPDSYNIIFEKEKGEDEKERRQIFFLVNLGMVLAAWRRGFRRECGALISSIQQFVSRPNDAIRLGALLPLPGVLEHRPYWS